MNKYYIIATSAISEKNKPLIKVCMIFRTEQKARKAFELLKIKYPRAKKELLEIQVKELHLVIKLNEDKSETIVGFGDESEAAEQVKERYLKYFSTQSFKVRPFQEADFIEKKGAFYA
ncbi:hypothetical protein ACWIUH_11760 [Ursidibacter arcticus]